MASQGNLNLKISDDQPSVEKLQNGRLRIEFLCSHSSNNNSWYEGNLGNILPDFGIKLDEKFGEGEWSTSAGYSDLTLVGAELAYISSAGTHLVQLTYETLTSTFVQEKDDTTDYELNGLRRVTRASIALAGTSYAKTVGTSTIAHQINSETAVTLTLAGYKLDDTDSYRRLEETWLESGILQVQEDKTDPANTYSVRAFNLTDSEVGSAISALSNTHTLVSSTKSDFEGIKTQSYVFKRALSFDIVDYEMNGLKRVTNVKINDSTPSQTVGSSSITEGGVKMYLAQLNYVDSSVLKESTFVWIQPGIVSESISIDDGLRQVRRLSFYDVNAPDVGVVVSKQKTNYNGYPMWETVTVQLANGSSPTSAEAINITTFVPFTYPGIATATEKFVSSGSFGLGTFTTTAYAVDLKTPVDADIEANIVISYQSSNDIGALPHPLWSPKVWTSIDSAWSYVKRATIFDQGSITGATGTSRVGSKQQ